MATITVTIKHDSLESKDTISITGGSVGAVPKLLAPGESLEVDIRDAYCPPIYVEYVKESS